MDELKSTQENIHDNSVRPFQQMPLEEPLWAIALIILSGIAISFAIVFGYFDRTWVNLKYVTAALSKLLGF